MQGTSSTNEESQSEGARVARINGARSDFVSTLARRVGELRTCLKALESDPGSPRLRDDLRRRIHALSAGARLLRFSAMATALVDIEGMLERAAAVGQVEAADLTAIGALLEQVPSLVWDEPSREQQSTEPPPLSVQRGEGKGAVPPSVLVVGPSGLADAIANPLEHGLETEIECECTESAATALELARSLAPDVAVVDADWPGARELIASLGRDRMTEPMPIIVVGRWSAVEDGAKWVAAGASRAMGKPISPHALRRACVELCGAGALPIRHTPLGQTTVDELTARIVAEVKRGLEDAVVSGRSTSVALGDGSEVLAAVWGAVARVRDLVMIKSGGAVRFSSQGPEGALPIAPWWGDGPRAAEPVSEQRAANPTLSFKGRRVVVADDDPAVTWFIGGVLRSAGADVREAHDGQRALERCFRFAPDVVISDVLMPGLDGFALCRALKRDIALRDVPVILLSWKEDLLQRLRDLGADADGYLRKEASESAILERVHEVLRPRARLEARLGSEGEIRGRLDGVTPRTLLEASARLRPDARVRIRDASFLYEIELRGGAPKSATRTTTDGSFQRGKPVVAALLGVRSGRFVVSRATGAVRGTLEGDLDAQMEAPIARARAALGLVGGTRLLEVHRVDVALDQIEPYLLATPEPARSLMIKLGQGASPRELILAGEVAPAELEDVLTDLASHGAIVGIRGAEQVDLLGPSLEQEVATLRYSAFPSSAPAPAAVKVVIVTPVAGSGVTTTRDGAPEPDEPPFAPPPELDEEMAPAPSHDGALSAEPVAGTPPAESIEGAPPAENEKPARVENGEEEDEAPSSLEAAVIRQISDPTPSPSGAIMGDSSHSIVDASELKSRSMTFAISTDPARLASSLPPDAIVPGSPSDEKILVAREGLPEPVAAVPAAAPSPQPQPQVEQAPQPQSPQKQQPQPQKQQPRGEPVLAVPVPVAVAKDGAPRASSSRRGRSTSFVVAGLIALGTIALLVAAVGSGFERAGKDAPVAPPAGSPASVASLSAPATPRTLDSAAVASRPAEPSSAPSPVSSRPAPVASGTMPSRAETTPRPRTSAPASVSEDGPIPRGVTVAAGQGLLDIETSDREAIVVDGAEVGHGPAVRLPVSAGAHEVRLRGAGDDRARQVTVRPGRRTRLSLSSAWTR